MQEFTFKQIDDLTFCVMGYEGDEAEVTVPASYLNSRVTVIYDNVFAGHKEITKLTIPDTVTDLGEFVFEGCENLRTIELPPSLVNFWGYTFCRSGLEEITLPDAAVSIPPFAFKECKNLRKVVCGSGMKKINAWAFAGCDRLEEVIYGPDTVVSPEAFNSKTLNP